MRQDGFSGSQRPTILVCPYKTSIPLLNQARVGGTVEPRLLEWGPPAEAQRPRSAARETLGRSRTCMSFKGAASALPPDNCLESDLPDAPVFQGTTSADS